MRKVQIVEKYAKDYPVGEIGWFHQWGTDCCEEGTYTTAIVELLNGKVEEVIASRIKFLEPYGTNKEENITNPS